MATVAQTITDLYGDQHAARAAQDAATRRPPTAQPHASEADEGIDALYAWWPGATPAPAPCPEAAFSLTLKGMLDGHDAMITVRGMTPEEFRRNLQAIRGLLDAPAQTPSPPGRAPAPGEPPAAGWCASHQVLMTLYPAKDGGKGWWSHKTEAGRWCKGK